MLYRRNLRSGEPVYEGEARTSTPRCGHEQEEPAPEPHGTVKTTTSQPATPTVDVGVTPTESMLARLESRGVHVAEMLSLNMHNPRKAVDCDDRDEAVIKAFRALDVDGSHSLSEQHLRGLVPLNSLDGNKEQVPSMTSVFQAMP